MDNNNSKINKFAILIIIIRQDSIITINTTSMVVTNKWGILIIAIIIIE